MSVFSLFTPPSPTQSNALWYQFGPDGYQKFPIQVNVKIPDSKYLINKINILCFYAVSAIFAQIMILPSSVSPKIIYDVIQEDVS